MRNNNDDEERSSPSLSTPSLNNSNNFNNSQRLNSNSNNNVSNSPKTSNVTGANSGASAEAGKATSEAGSSASAGATTAEAGAGASASATAGTEAGAGAAGAGAGAGAEAGAAGAAGVSFAPILIVVAVIVLVISLSMIIDLAIPSTTQLSSDKETQGEKMGQAMKTGYLEVFKAQSKDVVDKMNATYGCVGTINNIVENEDGTLSYITDACEIHILFDPEVEKYQEEVTGYINSINGAIALFTPEKAENDDYTTPEKSLTTKDEEGNIVLSEYGKEYKKTFSNEYTDSEGQDIVNSAQLNANKIFQTDTVDEWDYSNFHKEFRERQVQVSNEVCDVKKVLDSKGEPIRVCARTDSRGHCLAYQDKVETVCHDETSYITETYNVEVGDITIHMTYDIENYKKDEVNATINSMIGSEAFQPIVNNEIGNGVERITLDETTARQMFDEAVQNYYFNYMAMYSKDEYGVGYVGDLIHYGTWDYKSYIDDDTELGKANLFWSYSLGKKSEVANLLYKSDCYGGYPEFSHQCTQYAGTWFVDTFGFAAIRGGGVNVADNLIKDCNEEGACPVQFLRSNDVAPGAVVSFYPNHVAVVEEVKADGTVMMSHGNIVKNGIAGRIEQYSPYPSLQAFAAEYSLQIKSIAIPKKGSVSP